jgi:LysM repeat protein
VVHVLRPGDSLVRLATAYGLTVEQIATANGLTLNDAVADGTRLVIPLGPPAARVPGANPRERRRNRIAPGS